MHLIPNDYAEIETLPAYKAAQIIGASVSKHIGEEEYDRFLDPMEIRLLRKATHNNITFYLEPIFERYKLCVGLEAYVRGPESIARMIRRMFLGLVPAGPLPGIRGTLSREQDKKIELNLPYDRQEQIFKQLRQRELEAAIQAAFARRLRSLLRVYKFSDAKIEVVQILEAHYEEAMNSVAQ